MRIGYLEASCWCVGLAAITLYCSARIHGELERREAIAVFSQTRAQARDAGGAVLGAPRVSVEPAEAGGPDQVRWSATRIRGYVAAAAAHEESAELAAAVLRIPRAALEVPVYYDSSERNLNRGAGLIAGTGMPESDGNIAIAAHRDGYFRSLESVAVGDLVELETPVRRRHYRITELSIVEPTDISSLHDTEVPALTLVTCYPFYFVGRAPQRYIVRAVAIEST